MGSLLTNLQHAVRRLRQEPGFVAVVVLTLALGIGFNAAMFTLLRTVVLQELPWQDSHRLVMVWNRTEGREELALSEPELRHYREHVTSFDSIGAYRSGGANLAVSDRRLGIWVTRASRELFSTLKVEPLAGRVFLPEEFEPGNDRVVVLSHELWQSAFGGDRDVLGSNILLNGDDHTIVGVMPPAYPAPTDFRWVGQAELWLPLPMDPARPRPRSERYLWTIARLAPGVSLEQARTELLAAQDELERSFPDDYRGETTWSIRLVSVDEEVLGRIRPAILLFVAAVGLLLLLACANVANLCMARLDRRARELTVRSALGAGRATLVRELLAESLVLSLAGAALALLLLSWGRDAFLALGPGNVPRIDQVAVDWRAALFGLALAVATSFFFGLGPALRASSTSPSNVLRAGVASDFDTGKVRARQALLVFEVGIAVVLLVAAGLLVRSLTRLHRVDPGFDVENIVTADLMLYGDAYEDEERTLAFFDALLERVRALPDVEAAGFTNSVPFWNPGSLVNRHLVEVEEIPWSFREPPVAVWEIASPRLLETTGVALLGGRDFEVSDRESAPPVAIVSRSFAERFWPADTAIGKRLRLAGSDEAPWLHIVGISEDVRDGAIDQPPLPRVYVPLRQASRTFADVPRYAALMIRTAGASSPLLGAVRQIIRELDANLPLANTRMLEAHLSDSLTRYRLSALLFTIFSSVAVVLAGLGIYGVVSYVTGRRTLEIGIRIALGAKRRDVVRMVVGQALRVVLWGIGLGLVAALVTAQYLESLLFGVVPGDGATLGLVALFLATVACFSAYLPARKASRVPIPRALKGS